MRGKSGVHDRPESVFTFNRGGAAHLQSFMTKASSEASFFPDIFGLKEQLSLSEFENEYRDIDSKEYKSIVREIDRRIRLLPVYASYPYQLVNRGD